MRDPLAALNAELASHAMPSSLRVDIQLSCAESVFRLQTVQGSAAPHLRVTALAADAPAARSSVELSSPAAARRAAAGGRAALLSLLARGALRLHGDSLPQLLAIREALDERALERLHARCLALLAAARWLPDSASPVCMAAACRAPFTATRRRHHCRACGRLFCNRCAPRRAAAPRACAECLASEARPPVSAEAEAHAPPPPPPRGGAPEWLLEYHIEARVWTVRCLTHAAAAAAAAAALLAFRASPAAVQSLALAAAIAALAARRWLARYARVAHTCVAICLSLLFTQLTSHRRSATAREALWEMCHRLNARLVYDAAVALGGFWTKVAQGASVSSALPAAYGDELRQLQDAMPPDPLCEVQATLEAELGAAAAQLVRWIDAEPLGSATIAQVHRATLRVADGAGGTREVRAVLKVQHAGVAERLDVDILASHALAVLLEWVAPNLFRDLRPVVSEVAAITRAELDFREEAAHQALAKQSLAASGLHVLIPQVYPELVTRRVLAMEFVDGFKLSELGAASGHDEEGVRRVAETLVHYYGEMMHGEIFNYDPHPGNFLVAKQGGALVALDWGQARRLGKPARAAHAKLFLSILMEDTNLFDEACSALGMPLHGVATSPDVTSATMVGAMRVLLRDPRPSRTSARDDFHQLNAALGALSGDFKAIQGGGTDLFKGPLLPFSKTAVLLSEVCTLLGVSLPLLSILCGRGYASLLRDNGYSHLPLRHAPGQPARFILGAPPPPAPPPSRDDHTLHASLSRLLAALHAQGRLLGAQLAVVDASSGARLASLAVGHSSPFEPTPVDTATVFNLCEVSKLFVALSVLRMVERGALSLDSRVAEGVALEHVLAHTAGHVELLYPGVRSFAHMCDVDAMARLAGDAKPLHTPGARQQYHHASWGWLLARACTLAGSSVEREWGLLADATLGAEGARKLSLRAPEGKAAGEPRGRVATQSKAMQPPDLEGALLELVHVSRTAARAASAEATEAERVDGAVMRSLVGRLPWLEPSALDKPIARRAVLPGLQAYATASDAAEALCAAAKLLTEETLREALRSRKPPASALATPTHMQRRVALGEHAEWGLGVQLVQAAGTPPCWGHFGENGSFALVIPGRQPVVACLLLNRSGGYDAALEVLSAITDLVSKKPARHT